MPDSALNAPYVICRFLYVCASCRGQKGVGNNRCMLAEIGTVGKKVKKIR